MEIQQSSTYANFITSLGWIVEKIDGSYIFIKPFPLIGGLAKLLRITTLPSITHLLPLLKRHHVRTLVIEPDSKVDQQNFSRWCKRISPHIHLNRGPFIPTKTIRVSLTPPEEVIFRRFTEAKRRAVRRAEKNTIRIRRSPDIHAFFRLKNHSAGFFGFITTHGIDKLWDVLPEKNRLVLLAYSDNVPVAGVFLIFWNGISYYWIAGATKEGKKLFAPTLLVWEALKESKKRRCRAFDFVGVWDERRPAKNHEWKGFTKFKEGFGGKSLYYPLTPQKS